MTTIKQALNRMNTGHLRALENLSNGSPAFNQFTHARAAMKIWQTLVKWGAASSKQAYVNGRVTYIDSITDFGRELIAAYYEKYPGTVRLPAVR